MNKISSSRNLPFGVSPILGSFHDDSSLYADTNLNRTNWTSGSASIGKNRDAQLTEGKDTCTITGKRFQTQDLANLFVIDLYLNIKNLDASSNLLAALPSTTPKSLVSLNLSHNRFTSYADFPEFPNLTELNLSHNSLTCTCSLQLPKLRILNLSSNCIMEVFSLDAFKALEELDLSNNQIQQLEDVRMLSLNRNLKSLVLTGNPVNEMKNFKSVVRHLLPELLSLNNVPQTKQILSYSQLHALRTKKEQNPATSPAAVPAPAPAPAPAPLPSTPNQQPVNRQLKEAPITKQLKEAQVIKPPPLPNLSLPSSTGSRSEDDSEWKKENVTDQVRPLNTSRGKNSHKLEATAATEYKKISSNASVQKPTDYANEPAPPPKSPRSPSRRSSMKSTNVSPPSVYGNSVAGGMSVKSRTVVEGRPLPWTKSKEDLANFVPEGWSPKPVPTTPPEHHLEQARAAQNQLQREKEKIGQRKHHSEGMEQHISAGEYALAARSSDQSSDRAPAKGKKKVASARPRPRERANLETQKASSPQTTPVPESTETKKPERGRGIYDAIMFSKQKGKLKSKYIKKKGVEIEQQPPEPQPAIEENYSEEPEQEELEEISEVQREIHPEKQPPPRRPSALLQRVSNKARTEASTPAKFQYSKLKLQTTPPLIPGQGSEAPRTYSIADQRAAHSISGRVEGQPVSPLSVNSNVFHSALSLEGIRQRRKSNSPPDYNQSERQQHLYAGAPNSNQLFQQHQAFEFETENQRSEPLDSRYDLHSSPDSTEKDPSNLVNVLEYMIEEKKKSLALLSGGYSTEKSLH